LQPLALRCFVLWIMRPAMEIALDCIADAGPVPEALLQESIDSMAEARRYSRCFRAAARSMKGLLKALDRCEAYEEAYSMGFNNYSTEFASFGAVVRLRSSGVSPQPRLGNNRPTALHPRVDAAPAGTRDTS
jgi:hypothetical protein